MYGEISGHPDPVLDSAKMISHHEREIAELSVDRELAVEYLKAAMESLDNSTALGCPHLRVLRR
ncbi:hypothetical protein [Nitrosospira multiformis]|uniref:hypothetical protein n=1 Tax=Nitrosospira multiformis TaxID=1231 RepID=UPI000AFE9A48|nr:hypothetical protein [Nitrosospira multiformis]